MDQLILFGQCDCSLQHILSMESFFLFLSYPYTLLSLVHAVPSKYQKWSMNGRCKDLTSLTFYCFHVFLIHPIFSAYNMTGYATSLAGECILPLAPCQTKSLQPLSEF